MIRALMPILQKPLIGLSLASGLVMALLLMVTPVWELEDGAGLDLLYSLRGVRPAPEQVLIIALDSTSARVLGQSERPERWPRSLHARLVEGLAAAGVGVIGFDILFERAREPEGDRALAAAIKGAGNVVLVEQVSREPVTGPGGALIGTVDRRTQALPLFRDAALASGPFVMPKTPDGVFEFWGFVPSIGDKVSLPMLMARQLARTEEQLARLPADNGRHVLNLYGPLGTVTTIPYARALELVADPQAGASKFAGKAVLIGFSESNQSRQSDIFRTPYSRADGVDVSGVELCATALANLLEGSTLTRPAEADLFGPLVLWAVFLSLPWVFLRTRNAVLLTLALALAGSSGVAWAFAGSALWLPVIIPGLVAPALAGILGTVFHLQAARRREQQLERALDLGLTRQGTEKLAALLQGREGGRTVHGACLCSDIEAYTTLSEALSPEVTRNVLNSYFARFIPVIEAHGGHVMDIVGDSVLSLWLADDSAADACERARAAALVLNGMMNSAEASGALRTRFGLHYGPVFLGELGSTHHREIRAVGDIVNTCSRIQGANKHLGTRILASGDVVGNGAGDGSTRMLGSFVLAGKSRPVVLHEILPSPLPWDVSAAFENGRTAYTGGATGEAFRQLSRLAGSLPDDGPTRFFLARCRARQADPDLDADGIVVLAGK